MTIYNLVRDTTYYLLVTARNTSGLESLPSAELVGKTVVFDGLNPSKLIEDLRITETSGDPNSLTLSWSRPTHTIYGCPSSVATYEIYRGTTPAFIPSPATLIATIADPDQTYYVDVGARSAPSNWYYLVGSTDTLGAVSGLGLELPNGIPALLADLITSDTIVQFSWAAVTSDVRGGLTRIDKYMLYASESPISRAGIDAMTPLVDNIRTTSVEVPVDPGHKYYSVIVVDTRGNKSPY